MAKRSPNPIDAYVGHRVRLRRMLINMSQERLGEQLGLTFQQIQKYEKGANRISASRLYLIASILGVDVGFFYEDIPSEVTNPDSVDGFGEGMAGAAMMDFLGSSEGLQLNRAFAGIDDSEVRRRVLDLIKSLSNHD